MSEELHQKYEKTYIEQNEKYILKVDKYGKGVKYSLIIFFALLVYIMIISTIYGSVRDHNIVISFFGVVADIILFLILLPFYLINKIKLETNQSKLAWTKKMIDEAALEETSKNYPASIKIWEELKIPIEVKRVKFEYALEREEAAKERERALDYDSAIESWEELGEIEEAARVRKLKARQGSVRVAQKVVHGDEITKTDIRDSVVSKSSIGAGGKSKSEELRDAKALLDDGIIDDDEFQQMKKEILGK